MIRSFMPPASASIPAILLPPSLLAGVMLAAFMLAAGAAPPAGAGMSTGNTAGDPGPMVVTTDTASYCSTLSDRISARGALPPAVCALRREGDALCARGEVRTGIRRLRRALVALDAEGAEGSGAGSAEFCR